MTGKADQPQTDEVKNKIKKQNWIVSMLSDDGQPSMMRLQMFGWTMVTIFLFLIVILMGISHVGYLADKGAAASKPN